ncbi:MAG: helix-turn-helix domain-containing protein [Ruminococcaceae bacterium]|nr:helix-turn-helix domain-containing protein [Oscillospiraceae bacterium]
MNNYVTGSVIRSLREGKGMTQEQLAQKLFLSSKTISKWETGNGFPDINLLEPLAAALDISVIELLNGETIRNTNAASDIVKCRWYVCPVCGNVIQSTGDAVVSCCGITLPALCAEPAGAEHAIAVQPVDGEYFVQVEHAMSKTHYISFLAAVGDNSVQLVKLYPEGSAQAHFRKSRVKIIYAYCNHHGLFAKTI